MRDDFTNSIKITIAKRAGYLCSNPHCRKLTVGASSNDSKSTLLGIASHITAASPGGPRYDNFLSQVERRNLNNAIWLCCNCSVLIDKDPNKFTKEILLEWKIKIETETNTSLMRSNGEFKHDNFKTENSDKDVSIENDFLRIKETRVKKQKLEQFLNSPDVSIEAERNIEIIINRLIDYKNKLEDPSSGLYLGEEIKQKELYAIGYKETYLRVQWYRNVVHGYNHGILLITILKKYGHRGINYKENKLIENEYQFNRNMEAIDGWTDTRTEKEFHTSYELIDLWVKKFIKNSNLV